MAALDILVLNEATPQIIVPQSGDTYNAPRAFAIAAGTVTTDVNALNITQTWNAGGVTFTGLEVNVTSTASAAASLLMDLQVGGTSVFKVRKDGRTDWGAGGYIAESSASNLNVNGMNVNATGGIYFNPSTNANLGTTGLGFNQVFIKSAGLLTYNEDTGLSRSSAGVIAVGTGAAASVAGTVHALTYAAAPGTAITAGGLLTSGFRATSTANFGVFFGSGAPSISAAKGSLYLRSDGSGVADRMYVATDGAGTWTAVTTVG